MSRNERTPEAMKWLLGFFCLSTCASTGLLGAESGPRDMNVGNATQAHTESAVGRADWSTASSSSRTKENVSETVKDTLDSSMHTNHSHHSSASFLDGFISSLTVSVLSELGDRSFFTAIILSVTYSRILVFLGQIAAQSIMTAASVALSFATHLMPRWVTHYLSIGELF